MKKSALISVIAVVSILALGAFTTYAQTGMGGGSSQDRSTYPRDMSSSSMGTMSDSGFALHRLNRMIGSDVTNEQGENLGEIKDFVVDQQGRVAFALVRHGGFLGVGEKFVALPFTALKFTGERDRVMVNFSKDQFANAPMIDKDTALDRSWAENSYRYFGQTPYWFESGASQSGTMSGPGSSQYDTEPGQSGTGSRY